MGRSKSAPKKAPTAPKKKASTIATNPNPPVKRASTSRQASGDSPERKRSKFKEGQHIFTCRESDLKGNLKFTSKVTKERYEDIKTRNIVTCTYIDPSALETLGLREDVFTYIENIGWKVLCDINCPTYVELVREFYTTYEYKKTVPMTLDEPVIQFRLLGKNFKLSITDFNIACGFIGENEAKSVEYLNSACDFDPAFNPIDIYSSWANDYTTYNPKASAARRLHNNALKYLHKFLAYSYSGRKDSSQLLNKTEFFFLWAMKEKKRVNLGCWLAGQFLDTQVGKKRNLILGYLITHLAVVQGLLDVKENDLHVACEMKPLNLKSLEYVGLIGEYKGEWVFRDASRSIGKRKLKKQKEALADNDKDSEDELDEIHNEILSIKRDFSFFKQEVELDLSTIKSQLSALFTHLGFTPPSPPPAS